MPPTVEDRTRADQRDVIRRYSRRDGGLRLQLNPRARILAVPRQNE